MQTCRLYRQSARSHVQYNVTVRRLTYWTDWHKSNSLAGNCLWVKRAVSSNARDEAETLELVGISPPPPLCLHLESYMFVKILSSEMDPEVIKALCECNCFFLNKYCSFLKLSELSFSQIKCNLNKDIKIIHKHTITFRTPANLFSMFYNCTLNFIKNNPTESDTPFLLTASC